jgi:hypothetical protein
MKLELMNGATSGSICVFHPSGWIQTDLLAQWLRHFTQDVKPAQEDSARWTPFAYQEFIFYKFDQKASCFCNFPTRIRRTRCNHLICLMSLLKTFYAIEIGQWMQRNISRFVTMYHIVKLFGRAYLRAATSQRSRGCSQ